MVAWEGSRAIRTFHGHRDCVRAIVWGSSEGEFFTAGNDGYKKFFLSLHESCRMIFKWHIDDPKPRAQWIAHEGSFIYALARISSDRIVSVGEDRVIRIWNGNEVSISSLRSILCSLLKAVRANHSSPGSFDLDCKSRQG